MDIETTAGSGGWNTSVKGACSPLQCWKSFPTIPNNHALARGHPLRTLSVKPSCWRPLWVFVLGTTGLDGADLGLWEEEEVCVLTVLCA